MRRLSSDGTKNSLFSVLLELLNTQIAVSRRRRQSCGTHCLCSDPLYSLEWTSQRICGAKSPLRVPRSTSPITHDSQRYEEGAAGVKPAAAISIAERDSNEKEEDMVAIKLFVSLSISASLAVAVNLLIP